MSPLARRGRVLYVILATLIILETLWRISNALRSVLARDAPLPRSAARRG